MCLTSLCFSATAGAQIRHMPPARPPLHSGAVNTPVPPIITPGNHVVQSFGRTPQIAPARPRFRAVPSRQPVFNPGILPIYSYPYFPAIAPSVPYYYPDYYSATQPAPPPTPVPDYDSGNDLSLQIQQLNNEVRALRNEIMQVKAPPAPPPSQVKAEPTLPPPPPTPVVLIFKNGRSIETQGYAVVGPTLWVINNGAATEYATADLDVAATKAENLKRGTSFRAP